MKRMLMTETCSAGLEMSRKEVRTIEWRSTEMIIRCLLTVYFTVVPPALAQLQGGPSHIDDLAALERVRQMDDVDVAVSKAVKWLVARQNRTEGFFAGKFSNTYTALSCLALMSCGEQDGRTEHGVNLRAGLLYLAKQSHPTNGYFGVDGGRMYGHAICLLALCEGYGMLASPEDNAALGEAIVKGLPVTLSAQVKIADSPHRGGWRYEPRSRDADLSVTVWQIMSLRAAGNCGFAIPQEAIDMSLEYVRRTHSGEGFAYQPGRDPTPAMRAAGIVAMKSFMSDRSEADKAKIDTSWSALDSVDLSRGDHFYYQSHYLATAANMMGPDVRDDLLPRLERSLLPLQRQDGQFAKHTGHDGGVYSTAFAVVCLSTRYQYLPIDQ